jgi:ribosomal protein S18 acetylase RimI-like enzyme
MKNEASVWRLAVDHNARKMGIGKKLMQEVEYYAKTKNCNNVSLITGNEQSKAFYKKIGYEYESIDRA